MILDGRDCDSKCSASSDPPEVGWILRSVSAPMPDILGTRSLLKNGILQQTVYGTFMYRHFWWLQDVENVSNSQSTLPDRTPKCHQAQGCTKAAFES